MLEYHFVVKIFVGSLVMSGDHNNNERNIARDSLKLIIMCGSRYKISHLLDEPKLYDVLKEPPLTPPLARTTSGHKNKRKENKEHAI